MKRGQIIGEVWSSRHSPSITGQKLLLVALSGGDTLVVATDTLGAGPGDFVLVTWGSGARNVVQPGPGNREVLCDAAISLIEEGASIPQSNIP